jgi:hypothetical protein
MSHFLGDLFKGVGNKGWELARVSCGWAILSTSALAGFKLFQGQPLAMNDYADAMMKVFAGSALFIGAKDVAKAHADSKAST